MKLLYESFRIHKQLNQKLFDENNNLKEDIRNRLIEIADVFVHSLQENNVPIQVIDYWLLGSNAAYNYNSDSDIDVHVIVNTEDIAVDDYLLKLVYEYAKSTFNNKYDIKVKGHEVELYVEDIKSGAVSNGIYSLLKNEWIKEPTRPEEEKDLIIEETDLYKEWLKRYRDLKDDEIENFINDLYILRKVSLMQDGEFGAGNLVFKQFRNNGYLDELKERKIKQKSKELTLEKLEESSQTQLIWYKTPAGNCPTKEFYNECSEEVQEIFKEAFNLLAHNQIQSKPKVSKKLDSENRIFELRVQDGEHWYRITYSRASDGTVLLTGFNKDSNKTPKNEIERAIRNKKMYEKYKLGEVVDL